MRSFYVLPFLAAGVFLALATADADDGSTLLEQLSEQTVAATAAADAHLVTVQGVHGQVGVLVGTRPWLVVRAAAPTHAVVSVTFADRTSGKARRVLRDDELGITVYKLLDEKTRRTGLAVHETWDLKRGQLVVGGASHLQLGLLEDVDRASGTVRGPHGAGPLLLNGRKALVGLGGMNMQQCAACHNTTTSRWAVSDLVPWHAAPNSHVLVPGQRRVRSSPAHLLNVPLVGSHPSAHAGVHTFLAGPVIARVIADLDAHGRLRRAYLGVIPGRSTKVDGRRGVRLSLVLEDSPAARAGLKTGDLLLEVDGVPCDVAATVGRLLLHRRPGERAVLRFRQSDGIKEAIVELGDLGAGENRRLVPDDLGLTVQTVDDSLRNFLGLADDVRGVVVTQVTAGGYAATSGIQRGDVIQRAGEEPVRDVQELEAALATAQDTLTVFFQRKGTAMTQTIKFSGAHKMPRKAR